MTRKLSSILNMKEGFVALPRTFAEHLRNEITVENAVSLYYFLLLSANYASTTNEFGILKRGETDLSIREIAITTHSSYYHIRRLMKQLNDEKLIEYRWVRGHRRIVLPYYEEHCGRRVRTVEQAGKETAKMSQTDIDFENFWEFYHHTIPDVPDTDYEEARKAFARLSLKDRRAAAENVPAYFDRLDNTKHAKWAAHYLKERCFILPEDGTK